jgi:D-threonate/D-erythronate kinase
MRRRSASCAFRPDAYRPPAFASQMTVADQPSLQLGMIADDLTGACDAGVQFAQCGFSTLVRIGPHLPQSFDMAVLPTNSRNEAPATAGAKVREACQALLDDKRQVVYKKMDSTLRGNLGCELEAVMASFGYSLALVAPAYPTMGRTLEGGALCVTSSPAPGPVHLPDLMRQQCSHRVVHLGRGVWEAGSDALLGRLKDLLAEKTIVVLDSTCEEDLKIIARVGIELPGHALLAGSAGLAAQTARMMAEKYQKVPLPPATRIARKEVSGSVVLVMGSTHAVTRAQIEYLERQERVVRVEAYPVRHALDALQDGKHLLYVPAPEEDENRLKEFLKVLENPAVRGLALSGGDTAWVACRAIGASGIKLEREILPGVPSGRLAGGLADGLAVVTKAGGFGGKETLAEIVRFLAGQTRAS